MVFYCSDGGSGGERRSEAGRIQNCIQEFPALNLSTGPDYPEVCTDTWRYILHTNYSCRRLVLVRSATAKEGRTTIFVSTQLKYS